MNDMNNGFRICFDGWNLYASFLFNKPFVNFKQEREVKFFTETEENNQMRGPRTGVPYFL